MTKLKEYSREICQLQRPPIFLRAYCHQEGKCLQIMYFIITKRDRQHVLGQWTYLLWASFILRSCAQTVCTPNCHVVHFTVKSFYISYINMSNIIYQQFIYSTNVSTNLCLYILIRSDICRYLKWKIAIDIFVLNPWTEFDSLENLVGLKKLNVHQITAGDFL